MEKLILLGQLFQHDYSTTGKVLRLKNDKLVKYCRSILAKTACCRRSIPFVRLFPLSTNRAVKSWRVRVVAPYATTSLYLHCNDVAGTLFPGHVNLAELPLAKAPSDLEVAQHPAPSLLPAGA